MKYEGTESFTAENTFGIEGWPCSGHVLSDTSQKLVIDCKSEI